MKTFLRSDGRPLRIVEGFRERVISYRPSVSPRPGWSEEQRAASANKKRKRSQRLLASFTRWIPTLEGIRALDVGCGDGTNCVLLGAEPVSLAVGIDLHLPLFAPDDVGRRARMLVEEIAGGRMERAPSGTTLLSDRPVSFLEMDATRLGFRSASFDVVLSRSAAEHIRPIERALGEIARAVRPGGLVYLGIDPFYWLRGCHKRGVVDVPFAHARLSLEEFRRFVTEREGAAAADQRWGRIATLNRFTVRRWRETIQDMPCDVLEWREVHSELGAAVIEEHPEIPETLLPGIETHDLLTERIEVWLRKK